jgi:hypothetical protein
MPTVAATRQAERVIQRAEAALGPLSAGEKTDLLLDNMPILRDCSEAREIVLFLESWNRLMQSTEVVRI